MKKSQGRPASHEFSKLPEFDQAIRKLVKVPKEAVEERERQARTPRGKK